MPSLEAEVVISRLEDCLLALDELGFTFAGARLSHAIEALKYDVATMPDRIPVLGPGNVASPFAD